MAVSVAEATDEPVTNNGIFGGWHIKSYCGTASNTDIYMQLNEDNSFLLYQRTNSPTYTAYKGTFAISNNTISGSYDDGTQWASNYTYSIDGNGCLVFVNTYNSSEVTVYEPATMPSLSTLGKARLATKSDIKPL